jgi:hypothetical protein
MVDYTPYADKTIRNKKNPNPEERAYAEAQVQEEVNRILRKYQNEKKFLQDVAYRLAAHILRKEDEEDRNEYV